MVLGVMVACAALRLAAATNVVGGPVAGPRKMTREGRKAMMARRVYERTGGFLVRPGTQRGKVVYLNGQSRVPQAVIERQAANLSEVLMVRVEVVKGEGGFSPKDALARKRRAAANAAILFVDDASLGETTMLVAPENGWAVVNMAALASDGPDAAKLERRVVRETWRSFAHLLGAANSVNPKCVLRPVSSPAGIDGLVATSFCPEPLGKIVQNLIALGVEPAQRRSYRQACREGWAPAPTNDVQRAMWEQARAEKERGPSRPITIPPPKR